MIFFTNRNKPPEKIIHLNASYALFYFNCNKTKHVEVCHEPVGNHFKAFFTTIASTLVNKLTQGLNIFTVDFVNFDIFCQKEYVENCIFFC